MNEDPSYKERIKLTALQTAPFVSLPPGQVRRWPNLPALATKIFPKKITSEVAALSKPPRFPFSPQEKCVGGRCPTSLLVCVSPSLDDAPESLGSLELGSRAMGVKVVAEQNRGTVFMDAEALAQDLAQSFRVCARRFLGFLLRPLVLKIAVAKQKKRKDQGAGADLWGMPLLGVSNSVLKTPESGLVRCGQEAGDGFHGRGGALLTLHRLSGYAGVILCLLQTIFVHLIVMLVSGRKCCMEAEAPRPSGLARATLLYIHKPLHSMFQWRVLCCCRLLMF
jgi:hypothetical protein